MKIIEQVKYILFEIKNPISFRIKYLLEKVIKMPVLIIRNKFQFNINIPYLFNNDYIIENCNWKWLNKAKTDYDYTINPYIEKELELYFKSNWIFLDIWAHIWKWSIFVARWCKKVYSFEPNPITYSYLKRNIELNNLNNKILSLNNGIWNKKSELSFLIDENETSKSKFTKDWWIKIEVLSIDDFIKEQNININEIDLIKIDTEWFEFNVFKWMSNFLKKTNNVNIICEILDNQIDKNEIFNFLESFWFKYKKLETPADYLFYKE